MSTDIPERDLFYGDENITVFFDLIEPQTKIRLNDGHTNELVRLVAPFFRAFEILLPDEDPLTRKRTVLGVTASGANFFIGPFLLHHKEDEMARVGYRERMLPLGGAPEETERKEGYICSLIGSDIFYGFESSRIRGSMNPRYLAVSTVGKLRDSAH